jgi:hypothetical protein
MADDSTPFLHRRYQLVQDGFEVSRGGETFATIERDEIVHVAREVVQRQVAFNRISTARCWIMLLGSLVIRMLAMRPRTTLIRVKRHRNISSPS